MTCNFVFGVAAFHHPASSTSSSVSGFLYFPEWHAVNVMPCNAMPCGFVFWSIEAIVHEEICASASSTMDCSSPLKHTDYC